MPAALKNYFFKQNADGTLAIEADQPYDGAVTITWRPSANFPGTPVDVVIPQGIFGEVALDYVTDVARAVRQKKA